MAYWNPDAPPGTPRAKRPSTSKQGSDRKPAGGRRQPTARTGPLDACEIDLSPVFESPLNGWQDAEALGHALMLALGFEDARPTGSGADGGIDVVSAKAVCQVKDWRDSVGRAEVQKLAGAALGRTSVFLASSYRQNAIDWANQAGVALFSFNMTALVVAVNPAARQLAGSFRPTQMTPREAVLSARVTKVHRWLREVTAEAERLAAQPPAPPRVMRRNARRVAEFREELPRLQRDFGRVESSTFLKVAPLSRLSHRLDVLERDLRRAARSLGMKLS